MKTCVIYFSRTGNTKRLAEAISELLKVPVFGMTTSEPSGFTDYDLLILGTPVEGSRPAKETLSFVERLPDGNGKKAILFCTKAFWKGSTIKILEKELDKKGYVNLLSVDKKMKPTTTDFSDVLDPLGKAVEELSQNQK